MINTIRVMRWYFLLQISKAAMKAKRTLPGGIIVPETNESGEYSLCYGTIVQIGKDAHGNDYANKNFPEAQVGDTAILHHWVETEQPVHEDEEYIYVLTRDDNHNIKGVEKPDGTIIAHPSNIFCFDPEKEKERGKIIYMDPSAIPVSAEDALANWKQTDSGLFLFDGTFETDVNLRERIEEVELHSKHISEGSYNDLTASRVGEYQKEGEKLTRQLNENVVHELSLIFIHPQVEKTFEGIEQRDHVFVKGWRENKGYELNYKGIEFLLIKVDDVLFGLKKHLVGHIKVA